MKKSQLIKLGIIILIVIAIIIVISKISGNKNPEKQKLADLSAELKSSQAYLFEIEKDSETETTMAKKDNKTIIDHYSEENHSVDEFKKNIGDNGINQIANELLMKKLLDFLRQNNTIK